ncbi:MAG: alanine racemase [Candidatus Paceibacterota bacterium]
MKKHTHKTWVEVSKDALENNVKVVRKLLSPNTKLLAVVKSNAYGHGLVDTAKLFLKYGVDWLGVDNIDEAIWLRNNKVKKSVLVLGATPPHRFGDASKNDINLTLYNLEPGFARTNVPFHIKIDTGMSRQGVLMSQASSFFKHLPSGTNVEGVFTHYANADDLHDRTYPNMQLANFHRILETIHKLGVRPRIRHAAATTGLLTMPESHFDMVRAGLMLYGLWPSKEFAKRFKELKTEPALTWKTTVAQVKKIKKGTSLGYGITEQVKKDSRIAVLPTGYYDGYDRGLSSIGEVLIGGKRCKILGRVSMNLMVADVSKVKNVRTGSEVVLIGKQDKERITAEEMAEKINTISYEIVARINPLLPRIYV